MALIKQSTRVTNDPYVRLDDDEAITDQPAILLPLERFLTEQDAVAAYQGKLGVILAPADDTRALTDHFDRLSLIAIDFPAYKDGRGFTHARLLREQLRWTGELRAIGDVLYDQLQFMVRVGFDAFEVRKDFDAAHFEEAIKTFSAAYQGQENIVAKRHAANF